MIAKLLCWLRMHDWRVVRVLKPHLYIEHGMYLGCDLVCSRCDEFSSWRRVEREVWNSPFTNMNYEHPNRYCPCRMCVGLREAA